MTPDQISKALVLLEKIADRPYTITGAADWPILLAMCGVVAFMLLLNIGVVRMMWADIKASMREDKAQNSADHQTIWAALNDCQDDCCPRGGAVKRK